MVDSMCSELMSFQLKPKDSVLVSESTELGTNTFCSFQGIYEVNTVNSVQVLSGGVASNEYIRKTLSIITETTGLHLLCPPAKFCTDNGVMIAWWVY